MSATTPTTFLRGPHLYLRPIEDTDLPNIQRWNNDPETRQFMTGAEPFNATSARRWFDTVVCNPAKSDLVMAIVLNEHDRHIGYLGLHHIDWRDRNASTTTVIGEKDARGKGYAPEAKDLMVEYAFDTLGLHRLTCRVLSENTASIKSVIKSGFVEEGRDRESLFREGRWMDDVRFGLLAHEWRAKRAAAKSAKAP
jgi:RimJ/RimL family protein N-acetyltransferase